MEKITHYKEKNLGNKNILKEYKQYLTDVIKKSKHRIKTTEFTENIFL